MGVAIGCATRDRTVAFASTFAAFLSRAYDQIRMGAISQTNVNLVGSHCGVSIGKPDTYILCLSLHFCKGGGRMSCSFLTVLLYRRRRSLSDGLGGLGHVPCHPHMHCVLSQWCGVHGKGCWAVCKHKRWYFNSVVLIERKPNSSCSSFPGCLFHPYQQTRNCSSLLPRWEVWSGRCQGTDKHHVRWYKPTVYSPTGLKRLYLTRWCVRVTMIAWLWLELAWPCMRLWLLLKRWPVKVKINTALWWSRVGTVGPYLHVHVHFIMNSCREKYSRDWSLHHQAPGCSYHCGKCQSHKGTYHHRGGPLQGRWVDRYYWKTLQKWWLPELIFSNAGSSLPRWSRGSCAVSSGEGAWHCCDPAGCWRCPSQWKASGAARHLRHQRQAHS